MYQVRRTDVFADWLRRLRDQRARAKILARIRSAELGNLGDWRSVGDGVHEMRIHYGPGYRLYFLFDGRQLILLLCGGDKDSQARDIETARRLAAGLR